MRRTNLFHNTCRSWSPEIYAVVEHTTLEASLTNIERSGRGNRRRRYPVGAVHRKVIVSRVHLDMRLTLKLLKVMSQMSDDLVLFLQCFGLQNRLSLGLREIILTQSGNLMERAGGTWLYAITLEILRLGYSHDDHFSLFQTHLDLSRSAWITRKLWTFGLLSDCIWSYGGVTLL